MDEITPPVCIEEYCKNDDESKAYDIDDYSMSICVPSPYQCNTSPSFKTVLNRRQSTASLWSVQVGNLRHAGSVYEIALCLRELTGILASIDRSDRIKYCKPDFDLAMSDLRTRDVYLTDKIISSISTLCKRFFDECLLDCIPEILMQEIFMMLPMNEFSSVAGVCKEWRTLWRDDIIWKTQYKLRFLNSNPDSMPVCPTCPFFNLYEDRLAHPYIGDQVEVSWRGKFRLEANDVYQGLAWWVGVVVACSTSVNQKHSCDSLYDSSRHGPRVSITKYKIHYPGWESRWDEWVDRARLRWPMKHHDATSAKISKGDTVELWCCGYNVPGAWLESVVKRIKKDRYCVTRAHVSGSIWVPRERIRPRRKRAGIASDSPADDLVHDVNCHPSCTIM